MGPRLYNNVDRYEVRFNETADYATVYPYVMADTVGGDLKEEVYAFSGGLAKPFGRFHLGLNAGFNGKQTYRDRDPRIKSISSDITLSLSAVRELDKYVLGLNLDGRKYNQENGLEFVSELGSPLVYHDAGLGVYNDLLAGTRTDARFGGFGYGVALQLAPRQYKGWTAHVGFRGLNINKELGTIRDYVGEIREQAVEGGIAYLYQQGRQHFIARADVSRVKRQGAEAKFNNQDAQVGIIKISEDIRYSNAYTKFNLRAVYGQTGGFADWFIGIRGNYGDHLEQYADPDRVQSYTYINAGLDLTGRKQLGKVQLAVHLGLSRQQNPDAASDWDNINTASAQYGMLERNFAFLTVSGTGYNGSVRADFPINQNIAGFIQAGAGYDNGPAKRDYQAMLGLRF
ncbi:hypothetical protein MKQ70_03990 [Chitinophaga sedimenti]|uniref:DUF6850 family outer membrane beta-barrel protein n=1 Tax=Chitinophaga sedimenti TaxID=2033606 RepID=UPI0020057ED4|nr:DUF6850 family outer membrane beta-barrel protein [Chitinophaga sedimenti]MCK7554215.1 hypothetical protein [Chitinophaga sedimenti]